MRPSGELLPMRGPVLLFLTLAIALLMAAFLLPGLDASLRVDAFGVLLPLALVVLVWWRLRNLNLLKPLLPGAGLYLTGALLVYLGGADVISPARHPRLLLLADSTRALGFFLLGLAFLGVIQAREQVIRDLGIEEATRDRLDSELRFLALHDPLTNLGNRRALFERLGEARVALRAGTLLYLDLDGFRALNDQRGHETGDEILRTCAQVFAAHGEAYRMGGDEFVVLLWELSLEEGKATGQRIEAALGEFRERYALGLSFGLAEFRGETLKDPDALIRRADRGMHEAKRIHRETTRPIRSGQVFG